MYFSLLLAHSWLRWLVLIFLLLAIFLALRGWLSNRRFSSFDNAIRHWAATVAHIQLVVGIILFVKSPYVKGFFANPSLSLQDGGFSFFGLIHPLLMLVSVVLVTIGSALAKRKPLDRQKYQTMLMWFGIALLVILIAIPWPFSPLATRSLIRIF